MLSQHFGLKLLPRRRRRRCLPRFATEWIFLKHGMRKGRARPPAEPPHPSCGESGISTRSTYPVLDG